MCPQIHLQILFRLRFSTFVQKRVKWRKVLLVVLP